MFLNFGMNSWMIVSGGVARLENEGVGGMEIGWPNEIERHSGLFLACFFKLKTNILNWSRFNWEGDLVLLDICRQER